MQNIIPFKPVLLIHSADEAAHGASLYPALLVHNTEALIRSERVTAYDSVMGLKTGRKSLKDERVTLRSMLKTGREFLMLGRETLKPRLGRKHSDAWRLAGFATRLGIATTLEGVTSTLEGLADHLEDNPDHENATLNVTALRARNILAGITESNERVNEKKSEVVTLMETRDTAIRVLRTRLIDLKGELDIKLDDMDARWLKYGFNLPGAPATPDVPLKVIALLIGPNAVALKWDRAARASHYRVWKKVVGVDEDFINVGSPQDLDFAIENLPANATIEIAVSAVNDGGESAKSKVVTVMTA